MKILTIGVVLIVLSSLNATALSTTNVLISSVGTVNYHVAQRRLALSTWHNLPTQELVDRLHFEWAWDGVTGLGGSTSFLENLISLGINQVVAEVARLGVEYSTHKECMTCLNNQLSLSLTYPQIYGMYLNDYWWQIVNWGRTREQWEEIVSTIRSTNPNLKIIIPWSMDMEKDPNIDEYLSWVEFDEVICNYRCRPEYQPLEEMNPFLTRCENKFAGKKIWATANIRGENASGYYYTSESEFKYILNVLKDHYDAGKIVGIRINDFPDINEHPEYADYIEEILIK